jgi:hypothetical protein
MTKDEVREKMAEILALLREERDLKDQLVALEMTGEREATEKALRRQAELLAAIERLRWERLLPILHEVSGFVASKQGGAAATEAKPASAAPAAPRARVPRPSAPASPRRARPTPRRAAGK